MSRVYYPVVEFEGQIWHRTQENIPEIVCAPVDQVTTICSIQAEKIPDYVAKMDAEPYDTGVFGLYKKNQMNTTSGADYCYCPKIIPADIPILGHAGCRPGVQSQNIIALETNKATRFALKALHHTSQADGKAPDVLDGSYFQKRLHPTPDEFDRQNSYMNGCLDELKEMLKPVFGKKPGQKDLSKHFSYTPQPKPINVILGCSLEEAFKVFDINGDGTISSAEIKQVIGKLYTDQEIDEMVKAADVDGDGRIDYVEFQELMAEERAV